MSAVISRLKKIFQKLLVKPMEPINYFGVDFCVMVLISENYAVNLNEFDI